MATSLIVSGSEGEIHALTSPNPNISNEWFDRLRMLSKNIKICSKKSKHETVRNMF